MLQKVSPAAQQITTQQPFTNCQNAFNQQTPPVVKKIGNNAAQELRKVSSAPRLLNPKEATLPFSWFWQEGNLKEQEFVCSKFKWLDENKFEYTKMVIINGDNQDIKSDSPSGNIQYFSNNFNVCYLILTLVNLDCAQSRARVSVYLLPFNNVEYGI